eukprot:gene3038-3315_t
MMMKEENEGNERKSALFILQEEDGQSNHSIYHLHEDHHFLTKRHPIQENSWQIQWQCLTQILTETFLPAGYPHSVRPEYLQYQAWDALQGLSSYLRAVLTTRSVLAGIGVGSSTATPLSAAMTWVLRDGCGMIGGLFIAYFYSSSFEVYTKEWRLLADCLNNLALTLDLLSALEDRRLYIVTILVSTISKAGCGLIAGATKTRISSHFALQGHLADVSAKESTQETAIALIGLLFGMWLAQAVGESAVLTWTTFIALLLLHQYANYRLVKVLVFHTINPQRARLIVDILCNNEDHLDEIDLSPQRIASMESLLLPLWLSSTAPKIGASFQEMVHSLTQCKQAKALFEVWRDDPFIIGLTESGRITICLEAQTSEEDVVRAYMIGCYLDHEVKAARYISVEDKYQAIISELGMKSKKRCDEHWSTIKLHGWKTDESGALGVGSIRHMIKSE